MRIAGCSRRNSAIRGGQDALPEGDGGGDAQLPDHLAPAQGQGGLHLLDLGQDAPAMGLEVTPVLGEGEVPRGAADQPHAEALLQPRQALADDRQRHAELAGGRGQAAHLSDAGKDRDIDETLGDAHNGPSSSRDGPARGGLAFSLRNDATAARSPAMCPSFDTWAAPARAWAGKGAGGPEMLYPASFPARPIP